MKMPNEDLHHLHPSFSTETGLRGGRLVQFPAGTMMGFFLCANTSRTVLGPTQPPI